MAMCSGGCMDEGQPFPRTLLWLGLRWHSDVLRMAEELGDLRATSTWLA